MDSSFVMKTKTKTMEGILRHDLGHLLQLYLVVRLIQLAQHRLCLVFGLILWVIGLVVGTLAVSAQLGNVFAPTAHGEAQLIALITITFDKWHEEDQLAVLVHAICQM